MVEMVIRLEDESMLAPLKRVIKSIAGIADVMVRKDTNVKAKGEVYARQLARINELAALQNNWDDDGALPIEKKVIKNVKQLLEQCEDSDLREWVIFPDVNGTILLENKSGDASISIGNTEFSYVSSNGNGANVKIRTDSLLKTIRKING